MRDMLYRVRCIDYVEHPNERPPLAETDVQVATRQEADAVAHYWLNELYQRTDAGRIVTIYRAGQHPVFTMDQPPCMDGEYEGEDE